MRIVDLSDILLSDSKASLDLNLSKYNNKINVELFQIEVSNKLRNYIYVMRNALDGEVCVVDPTDADMVLEFLQQRGWGLDYILTTHHHHDHVAGNTKLKEFTDCKIVAFSGDKHRIDDVDIFVTDCEKVEILGQSIEVVYLPGHTLGHIAYHFPTLNILFSGDVIFSMGCGRIFEGSFEQGFSSLCRIADMAEDTLLCCTHEYTSDNAKFALSVEPNNVALALRVKEVKELRAKNMPTVPMRLAVEKQTNPFLRCDSVEIRKNLGMNENFDVEVFTKLRQMKNRS